MILKTVKYGAVTAAGAVVVGWLIFGRELGSYAYSSARSVQTAVKDSVPIEFELQRARHLVDEIVPEIHAHVRHIAQQEVEIADLRQDIERSDRSIAEEHARVQRLRDSLDTEYASVVLSGVSYSREQVREDLSRRFDALKEAEVILAGKQRLLAKREQAMAAAMSALEHTRSQKSLLEGQIASLEAQHKLVQAASAGTEFAIDDTKLAQTERLIGQIRRQLDVAERVLAHESRFTQPIPVETISEPDLLAEVDEHLGRGQDEQADAE